ncbi:coiled-coil domain-containing protein 28B-like [Anneissia japonica]|uniref:coiled-coil domain-containing protein 28B-like n=1 Tax=Anneissia japonica TaxID=1529436 RepID=UPI001425A69D|nr:coiled-coil domain-containing protein 28B-like [Anneissia japonica]XP_033121829.1 coiled-coil domain-containing protein 28B-like [Anneissia japonica]
MWQGASGSPKQGRPEMRGKLQRPTSFNPPHTQPLPQQYPTSARHTVDRNRKLGLVSYGANHGRTKPQQRHKSGYSGVRQQQVLPQVKLPELVPSTTCTEHTFLTDASEVRHMEEGLTQLLTDFHNGKLRAFSDDTCSFQKMENIRDLQEKLSRLHFDMDSKMQEHEFGSENARQAASQSMDHLLSNLNQLSMAVHSMQAHDD